MFFFENNNSVKEVLILKNKRIIATNRQQALYKNFEKSFEKEWGRKNKGFYIAVAPFNKYAHRGGLFSRI